MKLSHRHAFYDVNQSENITQVEEIDEYDKFWITWFKEGNIGILIKLEQ